MAQTVKKLSRQRSDKGSRIYRSETKGFDFRKARGRYIQFNILLKKYQEKQRCFYGEEGLKNNFSKNRLTSDRSGAIINSTEQNIVRGAERLRWRMLNPLT